MFKYGLSYLLLTLSYILTFHIYVLLYGLMKMSTDFSDVRFANAGFSKYSGGRLFHSYYITVAYNYTLIVSWLSWREARIKIVDMCTEATFILYFSDRGVREFYAHWHYLQLTMHTGSKHISTTGKPVHYAMYNVILWSYKNDPFEPALFQ